MRAGYSAPLVSLAPLRIVVDVSPLARPRTGIGNYIRGMMAGLAEAAGAEHELVAFGPSGPPGRERIKQALAGLDVEVRTPLTPHALRKPGAAAAGRPSSGSSAGSTSS